MTTKIPTWPLKEHLSGIRINRMSDTYLTGLFEDISKLHRNDHFLLIKFVRGEAELLVDFKKASLGLGSIFFLQPGQVLQMVRFQQVEGWVLYLDNKLIDDHVRLMIEDSLFRGPLLSLTESDSEWFNSYLSLLLKTYYDQDFSSLHRHILTAMVAPIVYKVASIFQANASSLVDRHSQRSVELTKVFKCFVRNRFKELKKPKDYAGLMHISISYLNDTVKSVTGFTLSYFIQQEMLREAQRLLCYTDLSVKEISSSLGYEDYKYFNRLFSKLTKTSPGRFRKEFKQTKTS
ncbi:MULTISPECIES: helix-turn-helix domain-containing protein [Olivibacter]|uniref:Helix-turn-helix domain-containing protein n=2 Tax=Olivibacter TaxID=376469 RepID=A0ABV6HP66_9SPHI|nr:AraC family transcriptional regulator [Olivibacter sp. LS-1]MDX3914753.1 AraC family transcriptional regulator [Pseudosphingobacterium sp.]QEL03377.1 helix-turn-helix domain-containing protein [Olivibacter sp. LS-1]